MAQSDAVGQVPQARFCFDAPSVLYVEREAVGGHVRFGAQTIDHSQHIGVIG